MSKTSKAKFCIKFLNVSRRKFIQKSFKNCKRNKKFQLLLLERANKVSHGENCKRVLSLREIFTTLDVFHGCFHIIFIIYRTQQSTCILGNCSVRAETLLQKALRCEEARIWILLTLQDGLVLRKSNRVRVEKLESNSFAENIKVLTVNQILMATQPPGWTIYLAAGSRAHFIAVQSGGSKYQIFRDSSMHKDRLCNCLPRTRRGIQAVSFHDSSVTGQRSRNKDVQNIPR